MGGLASLYWRGRESVIEKTLGPMPALSDTKALADYVRRAEPLAFGGAPWFESDSKAWADWIAVMHDPVNAESRRLLTELGLTPLLSHITDGMTDDDVAWVPPDALLGSATKALELITTVSFAPIRRVYCQLWPTESEDDMIDMMKSDLESITRMAAWARDRGIGQVTMKVNW